MSDEFVLNTKLGIDSDDRKIMNLLQADPEMTHVEIAKQVHKSQPAIGARILKLERKGLLEMQYGINLKENRFTMLLASLHAKYPNELLKDLDVCPFVVQSFKTTGQKNIATWMIGTDLDRMETIVERHFRSNPNVNFLGVSVAIEPIKKMILPLNFAFEGHNKFKCSKECHNLVLKAIENGEGYQPVDPDKSILNKKYGLNNDDKRIIMFLENNPTMTHSAIGDEIGKSQPAIGSKISKLKARNFLGLQKGVNFKKVDQLHLVQVSISALDNNEVLNRLNQCPFIINGFRTSGGEHSLVVYVSGHSLEKIDDIIDYCIRSDENVRDIRTKIILKISKDLILPYNFGHDFMEDIGCFECQRCNDKVAQQVLDSLKEEST
ncbi:AsnC family transcriptional regulator [Candidatus Bathyarchaeota archaeon]|nr:AsnC family transcriptional regulator [Candidatus Bathyarchaeota archaeon]